MSELKVTQAAQNGIQMTYGYSATQNNGKVAWATDATLGETVNYTYDLLNRLAGAAATDNAWGNGYVYDGYGNLLQKTVTAGSAPSLSQTVNVGNNQIVRGILRRQWEPDERVSGGDGECAVDVRYREPGDADRRGRGQLRL